MTKRDLARWRMNGQRLWGSKLESPNDVLVWMGAVQAQEFAYAKWSLAQRTTRPAESKVDEAFDDGRILRIHILRPTWHFVSAEDIRWLIAVSGPRVDARSSYRYRQFGLDDGALRKSRKALVNALSGGRYLTRKELAEPLERAGIDPRTQQLPWVLMHAELKGLICSGPTKGKQQTYALLDERVPKSSILDRDDALAELIIRYFTSRGPATIKDFVRWSGLTMSDARVGLEAAGPKLEEADFDGRTYWFGTSPPRRTPRLRVDLVQGYDETIMSYSESRDVLLGIGPARGLRPTITMRSCSTAS